MRPWRILGIGARNQVSKKGFVEQATTLRNRTDGRLESREGRWSLRPD
jgi:hypothetical protein